MFKIQVTELKFLILFSSLLAFITELSSTALKAALPSLPVKSNHKNSLLVSKLLILSQTVKYNKVWISGKQKTLKSNISELIYAYRFLQIIIKEATL